jgi:5-methylcytosine-specific restriction endonuclease McrA
VRCGGLAQVVDHITPHRGDPAKFWDAANWQALCKRCHDRKTMTEDRTVPPVQQQKTSGQGSFFG